MFGGCHRDTRPALVAVPVGRFGDAARGDTGQCRPARAQSDVLGVVALAAVAIVLAAGIGVFLFSETTGDDERESVIVDVDSSVTDDRLTVSHDSGNVLDPEAVSVLVDGNRTRGTFELASSPAAGEEFAAGDRWVVGPGLNLTGQFRVVVVHDPTNAVLHEASYTVDGGPVPAESLLSGLDVAGQGPDATVTEGDAGGVTVDVTNVGTENDSFDVTLTVDSALTRSESTADLAGGDSETVTFTGVTGGLDPATYDVSLSTDNDTTTGTLTVTDPPETLDSGVAYGLQNQSVLVRDRSQSDRPVVADLDSASGEVRALAWSPDGSRLAYGSFDSSGTVYVVNGTDWTVERTLDAASDSVLSLAWSPDGSRLAYGSFDGNVYVHETTGWSRETTLTGAGIWSLAWSPDSTRLVSGGLSDAFVHETGTWSTTNLGGSSQIDSVAWSPGGDSLAVGREGSVEIYRDQSGTWTRTRTLTETSSLVRSVAWSSDGSRLAAGTDDAVYVYEANTWALSQTLTEPGDNVQAVAWSGDDSRLFTGSDDATLYVYDTTDYGVARTFDADPAGGVRSLGLLPE